MFCVILCASFELNTILVHLQLHLQKKGASKTEDTKNKTTEIHGFPNMIHTVKCETKPLVCSKMRSNTEITLRSWWHLTCCLYSVVAKIRILLWHKKNLACGFAGALNKTIGALLNCCPMSHFLRMHLRFHYVKVIAMRMNRIGSFVICLWCLSAGIVCNCFMRFGVKSHFTKSMK